MSQPLILAYAFALLLSGPNAHRLTSARADELKGRWTVVKVFPEVLSPKDAEEELTFISLIQPIWVFDGKGKGYLETVVKVWSGDDDKPILPGYRVNFTYTTRKQQTFNTIDIRFQPLMGVACKLTMLGIFELKGDILTLCCSDSKRPTAFPTTSTDKSNDNIFRKLKRNAD